MRSETELSSMLHKFDATRYQDVSELHKTRDSVIKHLNELSEELNRINSEVEKTTAQLNASRRRFAVTEKEIKDTQSEIFLLHGKRTEIDEAIQLLVRKIESRESELAELSNSKNALNRNIENVDKDIQEISDSVAALEAKKIELSSRVDEMEAEKRKLSEDISKILSRTSLNRDKIEVDLNDLSTALFNNIAERDALKHRLSVQETTMNKMSAAISELEQEVALLEEVKALQGEKRALKIRVEEQERASLSLAAKLKELQKRLADKEEQLDKLSTENAERKKAMVPLEEQVALYDETLSAVHAAQERSKRSLESVEQSSDDMIKLLINKPRLEDGLRMAGGKVNRMVRIMRAIS